MRLTSVISYSPRADGFSALAISTTLVVVEVEAGHRPVRPAASRASPRSTARARRVELDHAVALRVGHVIGEHRRALLAPSRRAAAARRGPRRRRCCRRGPASPGSPATNASPMTNACASPLGVGCSAYSKRMPHCEPSPSRRRNIGRSCGVEMIRTSRMPASINDRQRIVDHRLVVDRHELLGDGRG